MPAPTASSTSPPPPSPRSVASARASSPSSWSGEPKRLDPQRAHLRERGLSSASRRHLARDVPRYRVAVPAATLLTATQIRDLARRHGFRPSKALGQNFVVDPNTIRRIVRLAEISADDRVLGVGAGGGALPGG